MRFGGQRPSVKKGASFDLARMYSTTERLFAYNNGRKWLLPQHKQWSGWAFWARRFGACRRSSSLMDDGLDGWFDFGPE
jgi:hypothetical protein